MKFLSHCKPLILSIGMLILLASVATAYNIHNDSDKNVKRFGGPYYGGHEEMTIDSIDMLSYDPILEQKLKANRNIIKDAAAAEDMPAAMVLNHFYNPANNEGLTWYLTTAKQRAVSLYDSAVKSYYMKWTDSAWSDLGHALHLVQDMSAPSHVQASPHMYQSTNGLGYEWWVAKNWGYMQSYLDKLFLNFPYLRNPSIAGDMEGLMDAVANRTYADN